MNECTISEDSGSREKESDKTQSLAQESLGTIEGMSLEALKAQNERALTGLRETAARMNKVTS